MSVHAPSHTPSHECRWSVYSVYTPLAPSLFRMGGLIACMSECAWLESRKGAAAPSLWLTRRGRQVTVGGRQVTKRGRQASGAAAPSAHVMTRRGRQGAVWRGGAVDVASRYCR